MSHKKRARSDFRVPDWLSDCPLEPAAVHALFEWLDKKAYCIASTDCLEGKRVLALEHVVSVVIATGYKGARERLYCDTCVDHCECCGSACDDFYDADVETPHDNVCYNCFCGDDSCEHR
jgi:hypothetical protein